MQRAVSVVRLALSLMGRSQQKQYIMLYNTVVPGIKSVESGDRWLSAEGDAAHGVG